MDIIKSNTSLFHYNAYWMSHFTATAQQLQSFCNYCSPHITLYQCLQEVCTVIYIFTATTLQLLSCYHNHSHFAMSRLQPHCNCKVWHCNCTTLRLHLIVRRCSLTTLCRPMLPMSSQYTKSSSHVLSECHLPWPLSLRITLLLLISSRNTTSPAHYKSK